MEKNKKTLFNYDPEADVLSWEITSRPIEYAREFGNVVIHFSKNHSPVLIEILEATKLLTSAIGILEKSGIALPKQAPALSSVTPKGFSESAPFGAIGNLNGMFPE